MRSTRLLISIISIGTLLEWAEYIFYGYMTLTLSSLFFPNSSLHVGLLKAFGIFAVGYLMRPLGAILFGHIGDKWGRKPALLGSLLLMGIATCAIGCLPTFSAIGISAPIFLLLLRMLQGLAISGEYNGAGIFLIETNGQRHPCLAGSWVSASAAAGMVMGGIAGLLTSLPTMPSWAWRVPFLLGGLTCFVAAWLRKSVKEFYYPPSSSFPLIEVLKNYQYPLVKTAAIAAFTGVYVYIGNIYIVVFLKQHGALPTYHATFFAIFGEIVVMLLIPVLAYIADRSDAYKQYRYGLLLTIIGSPVIFLLSATGNYYFITLAMLIYGILNAVLCGPMVKLLFDQFPTSLRYSGVSFGYSISAAIFSGTAPLIAQFMSSYWLFAPSLYVSLIALLAYVILRPASQPKTVDKLNFLLSN